MQRSQNGPCQGHEHQGLAGGVQPVALWLVRCSSTPSWAQHPAFLLLLLICARQGTLEETGWFPWQESGARVLLWAMSPYVLLALPMFPLET